MTQDLRLNKNVLKMLSTREGLADCIGQGSPEDQNQQWEPMS